MNFGDPRLPERFWAKIRLDESGCWLWTGARQSRGYGSWSMDGRRQSVHRITYQSFVGAIPDGLTIDHLCRTKPCCNPAHLEVVTVAENVRRARSSPITHCRRRGHPLTPETVYVNKRGQRSCKECHRERGKGYGKPGRPSAEARAALEALAKAVLP